MSEGIESLRRGTVPIPDGRYLFGLSGGADSVALLLILLPEIRTGRIKLEAVHVNHGLRGDESDSDQDFCSELCSKLNVPFSSYRADLSGRTDEAAARKERFAVFRRRLAETGADALILAHHADDQAETFMMRLLRGSGPDGLEAMKTDETVFGIRILRPMLHLRRDDIREAMRKDGISWREDSTNLETVYLRNRIRTQLIPVMEQLSESAVEKICGASALIAQDNEALNAEAQTILNRLSRGWLLDAETLAVNPTALRHRVLRMWWASLAPELDERVLNFRQTETLDNLLRMTRGVANLPAGMHAVRCGRYLFMRECIPQPPVPVKVTGKETRFGMVCLKETVSEKDPGDGRITQEVPYGFTRGCVIRTRRPGDRIRPFGSTGSRKLQDYLTDRHVPEPLRDVIPLLCRDNEVLLVCGIGAGQIPEWTPEASSVRLTWEGNIFWIE